MVHSGLCGQPGNLRFHMVFKSLAVCGHKLFYLDELGIPNYPEVTDIDKVLTTKDPVRNFGDMLCNNYTMVPEEIIRSYLGIVTLKK